MTIANANYREGVAYSPDGAMYVALQSGSTIPSPTFTGTVTNSGTITGGTITAVAGVRYQLSKWAVPFIVATSGTMGNNGAVSGMTALDTTYSSGAWLYLPANAIAAGSAVGWYWFVASSTTAGTVYNSTYTTGTPTAGTTTAFATTGPGAFTGVTSQIVGPQITVAANTVASTGALFAHYGYTATSSANGKTMGVFLGATDYNGGTNTSTSSAYDYTSIYAANATGAQWGITNYNRSGGSGTTGIARGTTDLTASQTFSFRFTRATATENMVLQAATLEVLN